MNLPGRRSTGGVVKAGHGGWSINFWGGPTPTLGYTNPDTGDGASRWGWNLLRSYRWIKATMAEKNRKRGLNG